MADRTRTQIGALSGGQRRRAFLARALAADPDLYLLDEPVTGVDITTQEDLVAPPRSARQSAARRSSRRRTISAPPPTTSTNWSR